MSKVAYGGLPTWPRRFWQLLQLVAVTGLLVVFVVDFARYLLQNRQFGVTQIEIAGNVWLPEITVLQRLSIFSDATIWSVSPSVLCQRVEELPWIRTACVAREYPNGLTIEINEKVPVAVCRSGYAGRKCLIDSSAELLAPADLNPVAAPAEWSGALGYCGMACESPIPEVRDKLLANWRRICGLPHVYLPMRKQVLEGGLVQLPGALELSELLAANQSFPSAERICCATWDDDLGWILHLAGDDVPIRTGSSSIGRRLKSWRTARQQTTRYNFDIAYVDLRFDEQGIVMHPVNLDPVRWNRICRGEL
jgi:cell division septal protein FtsQ